MCDPVGRRLERRAKRALLPLACRLFASRDARDLRSLSEAARVLVVRQDNRLGNLVLLSPLLQALRILAPSARIALLAGDRYGAIMSGCPWIDELIVERKRWLIRHLYAYPGFLRDIRARKWDVVFEASNPDTHSFYNAFLSVVSGAPHRVGFFHPRSQEALNRPVRPPERECHYSLAPLLLLTAFGDEPPLLPMRLPPMLEELASRSRDACAAAPLVVHPGARGAKRWPAERFAHLLETLSFDGPIVLIGERRDAPLLNELSQACKGRAQARPLDDLSALVSTLGGARAYVGCDTGPMHIAAALGLPVLALFLTSNPLRYAPLEPRSETLLLGERSRAYAAADHSLAQARGFDRAEEEELQSPRSPQQRAFFERVAAARPRLAAGPEGADHRAEVAFVRERLIALLERSASVGERPAIPPAFAIPTRPSMERRNPEAGV